MIRIPSVNVVITSLNSWLVDSESHQRASCGSPALTTLSTQPRKVCSIQSAMCRSTAMSVYMPCIDSVLPIRTLLRISCVHVVLAH